MCQVVACPNTIYRLHFSAVCSLFCVRAPVCVVCRFRVFPVLFCSREPRCFAPSVLRFARPGVGDRTRPGAFVLLERGGNAHMRCVWLRLWYARVLVCVMCSFCLQAMSLCSGQGPPRSVGRFVARNRKPTHCTLRHHPGEQRLSGNRGKTRCCH